MDLQELRPKTDLGIHRRGCGASGTSETMKCNPGSPDISNRSMSLKAYQMPKPYTEAYNNLTQDFTTLESYHDGNYLIFCRADPKVTAEIQRSRYKVIHQECELVHI